MQWKSIPGLRNEWVTDILIGSKMFRYDLFSTQFYQRNVEIVPIQHESRGSSQLNVFQPENFEMIINACTSSTWMETCHLHRTSQAWCWVDYFIIASHLTRKRNKEKMLQSWKSQSITMQSHVENLYTETPKKKYYHLREMKAKWR